MHDSQVMQRTLVCLAIAATMTTPGAANANARRQSLEATGEIREYAAPHALVLRIGSTCPAGHG